MAELPPPLPPAWDPGVMKVTQRETETLLEILPTVELLHSGQLNFATQKMADKIFTSTQYKDSLHVS